MTRGNHNAAGKSVMERSEVHHFRPAKAYVHHIRAAIRQAAHDSLGDGRRARTDIIADTHRLRMVECCIRAAYAICQVFVHFGPHDTANIIGLEAFMRKLKWLHGISSFLKTRRRQGADHRQTASISKSDPLIISPCP